MTPNESTRALSTDFCYETLRGMRTLDRVPTTRVAHQKEHLVVRVHGHDDGLVARIGAGERKLVDVAAGSRACVRVRRRLGEETTGSTHERIRACGGGEQSGSIAYANANAPPVSKLRALVIPWFYPPTATRSATQVDKSSDSPRLRVSEWTTLVAARVYRAARALVTRT